MVNHYLHRIISWENRNSIIYANGETGATIVGIAGNADANTNRAKWILEDNGNITNKGTGYVLDVCDAKYENNTRVNCWKKNGNKAQVWTIENVSSLIPKDYVILDDVFKGKNMFANYVGKYFRIVSVGTLFVSIIQTCS